MELTALRAAAHTPRYAEIGCGTLREESGRVPAAAACLSCPDTAGQGKRTTLRTRLCDVSGIDVPIILAPMGSATSAEFAASVSNEGGLGGIGSLFRTTTAIKRDIDVVRTLTKRHYAVNHIPQ